MSRTTFTAADRDAVDRTPPIALLAFGFATAFYFYAFAQRVAPGVMTDELMRDFAVGGVLLGNLSAFYFYSYAVIQLPVGILMDRFGPRRLLTIAVLVGAAGSVLFGGAGHVEVAYLGRLLVGFGAGFGFVGVLTIAALWFPARRFALMVGIAQMAGMAGAVAGSFGLGPIVAGGGWRSVFVWAGVGAALLAIGLWLTIRDRPSPERSDHGLLAGFRVVVRNPQTWLAALFGFSIVSPSLAFAGLWGIPYLGVAYGLERAEAGWLVALMFIGWGAGAPLVGWLSDRIGRRPLMIVCSTMATCLLVPILFVTGLPIPVLEVLYVAYGACACSMALSFACVRGHNPSFATGAALGIANTAVMAAGATFQPLVGGLLDLGWTGETAGGARIYPLAAYHTAFTAFMVSTMMAIVAAFLIREPPRLK